MWRGRLAFPARPQVAQDIGYSVNQIARGLNRQRSDLVGIIASRLDNPHR